MKNDSSVEAVGLRAKLSRVEKLMQEEKSLKVQIKKDTAALHALTKETIEQLTDEQVCMLLEKKWIESLILNLYKLPDRITDELISKIHVLKKKYEGTYFEVEKEIKETERELAAMIDELEGNEFDMKGLGEFKALLIGE